MSTQASYTVTDGSPGLILRALYFLVIGLWLSGPWVVVAWIACVTVIGLPLGIWMLHRLPLVTTLKPVERQLVFADGGWHESHLPQLPFLLRALWFVLVGWWLSALWLKLAWAATVVIIGLPLAFWMFDRTPAILTLERR
ncbi:MAG: YccF domain-containing protein [Acidobacteriota bacterium]